MEEPRLRKAIVPFTLRPKEAATALLVLWLLVPSGCSKPNPSAEQEQSIAVVARLGGTITRDVQVDGDPVVKVDLAGRPISDADLQALRGLTRLHSLVLRQTKITDAGIPLLKATGKLRDLDLDGTSITDAGVAQLGSLTSLRGLYLSRTEVTDAGLSPLQPLTKLRELGLGNTKVTDAGLIHLRGLTQLRKLDLQNTAVTRAGIEELRKELPNLWIVSQSPTASAVR
jgi:hypothetical protein